MLSSGSSSHGRQQLSAAARLQLARARFAREFGAQALAAYAPGRVNLIGEHIDYAGGSVLPFAIAPGISAAAGYHPDGHFRGARVLALRVAPDSPVQPGCAQLEAAARMALEVAQRLAAPYEGLQLCVWSNLPPGGGLSSSAAFCVAVAGALAAAAGAGHLSPLALCHLCRDAEEAASGVRCGLMDQYAVVFGQAGQALHFDPQALTHEYIPLKLQDAVLALLDSGQPRTLAASGYNARRDELAAGHPLRLRHVATERQRVHAACAALQDGDMAALGSLLSASHASLQGDYAASTPELDLLCSLLLERGAAHGARLTGAGFGGNVLALLPAAALEPGASGRRPIDMACLEYEARTGLLPELRLIEPGDGAQVWAGRLAAGERRFPLTDLQRMLQSGIPTGV